MEMGIWVQSPCRSKEHVDLERSESWIQLSHRGITHVCVNNTTEQKEAKPFTVKIHDEF